MSSRARRIAEKVRRWFPQADLVDQRIARGRDVAVVRLRFCVGSGALIDAVRRGAIPGATASKVVGVVHGTSIGSMVSRVCRQHRVMTAGCRNDLEVKMRRVLRMASRR